MWAVTRSAIGQFRGGFFSRSIPEISIAGSVSEIEKQGSFFLPRDSKSTSQIQIRSEGDRWVREGERDCPLRDHSSYPDLQSSWGIAVCRSHNCWIYNPAPPFIKGQIRSHFFVRLAAHWDPLKVKWQMGETATWRKNRHRLQIWIWGSPELDYLVFLPIAERSQRYFQFSKPN